MTHTTRPSGADAYRRVVVVGAGPAGLAMGNALVDAGFGYETDFVVLDAAAPSTTPWATRRADMILRTTARETSLRGAPIRGEPHQGLRAGDVNAYLARYTELIGVSPYWSTAVHAVDRDDHGHGLALETSAGVIIAGNVVAATGGHAHPLLPEFATDATVAGASIHSHDYAAPSQIPPGPVVIVGDGLSGRETALDLRATHPVSLATSDTFQTRLSTGTRPDRTREAIPLDLLRRHGITVVDRAVGISDTALHTQSGRAVPCTSVVWATGYRHGFDWLPAPIAITRRRVLHRRGSTEIPGLFVIGTPEHQGGTTPTFSQLGRDAKRLARIIGRRP